MILESVASALREAGRVDEAYEALKRGAELERRALQELTELQLGFDRATLETKAARHEADALAQKNRELEEVLEQLAQAHGELQERTAELEALQERLRERADRDALTGLHNRRFLMETFARHLTDPLPRPISIAILDLDNFKDVNDEFGHPTGDRVLVRAATLLRANVRPSDTLARSGGEEFVLVMPETGQEAALAVCERLLESLRSETWRRIGIGLKVTASMGVATASSDPDEDIDLVALSEVADERLYVAKRAGRDRVAVR
jgi:diguanylate cyclase (GGDEF)-like protein